MEEKKRKGKVEMMCEKEGGCDAVISSGEYLEDEERWRNTENMKHCESGVWLRREPYVSGNKCRCPITHFLLLDRDSTSVDHIPAHHLKKTVFPDPEIWTSLQSIPHTPQLHHRGGRCKIFICSKTHPPLTGFIFHAQQHCQSWLCPAPW